MCFLLGEHADTDQSSHAAVWEPLRGVLGVSDGALPAEGNLLLVCIHSSGKTLALVTCVVPNQKLWDPEYSNIWNCLSGSMMPQWSDMMCYSKNVSALKTHMWSTDEPCLGLDPVPNICMCLCSWACPHPAPPFIPGLQFCFLWNDLITLARTAVYDEWEVKSFSRFRVLTFSFSFLYCGGKSRSCFCCLWSLGGCFLAGVLPVKGINLSSHCAMAGRCFKWIWKLNETATLPALLGLKFSFWHVFTLINKCFPLLKIKWYC